LSHVTTAARVAVGHHAILAMILWKRLALKLVVARRACPGHRFSPGGFRATKKPGGRAGLLLRWMDGWSAIPG